MKRKTAPKKKAPAKPSIKADAKAALFVEAYIQNGGNGAAAYTAAGWRAKDADVAAAGASRLLRSVKVAELLEKRRAEILERSMLTSDEVHQMRARIVRFDPAKLVDEAGNYKQLHEIDIDTRLALNTMEATPVYEGRGEDRKLVSWEYKLKGYDKNVALEQASKVYGHYREDNKQKGDAAFLEMKALIDASKFEVRP